MPSDGCFTRGAHSVYRRAFRTRSSFHLIWVSGRSGRLVQRQRKQRLQQIFELLDYEGEGEIINIVCETKKL